MSHHHQRLAKKTQLRPTGLTVNAADGKVEIYLGEQPVNGMSLHPTAARNIAWALWSEARRAEQQGRDAACKGK